MLKKKIKLPKCCYICPKNFSSHDTLRNKKNQILACLPQTALTDPQKTFKRLHMSNTGVWDMFELSNLQC